MDVFGCMLIGTTVALGGGTIRDAILLGNQPIGWMMVYDEMTLCIVVTLLTFFAWPYVSRLFGLTENDEWIFWLDAIGETCLPGLAV